ncbi:hypothetical protein DFH09DRAFT_966484 [Mycena vulgaris]|nr:hypothetical protein DFH09DRAFT_966484 [Mycena vulgaris]
MPPEIRDLLPSINSGPIFGLPFEIMSEVFFHCLPGTPISPNKSHAPLLLGQICSGWRDIALKTPILWASLAIHRTSTAGVSLLTDLWLSRARGYPLLIHVHDHEGDEDTNRELFFETICRRSSQWQDVALSVPFNALSRLWLEGPLPMLERLAIGSHVSVQPIQPITGFSDAPLLREVHLALDDFGSVTPRAIVLPWVQLTRFTGDLLSIQECLYVLEKASSLVECNFYACIGGQPSVTALQPLPLITRLRLDGNQQRNLMDVLHYLTLPTLEFLELRNSPPLAEHPTNAEFALGVLRSFLSRSSCPLRELHLVTGNALNALLFHCFGLMPSLEILDIIYSNVAIGTATLKWLHTSLNIFPRLKSLSMHYTVTESIPYDDAVIAMLFSRSNTTNNRGTAQLERFKLSWTGFHVPYPDAQILDRFKVLVGRGMQVHLGPSDASWI